MPRLQGHFPLTTTMCLRSLALSSIVAASPGGSPAGRRRGAHGHGHGGGAGDSPAALVRDTLATLFQRPFYAEGRPGLLQGVQHLFRFSTHYLAHAGAVNPRGEPVGEPRRCPPR